VLPEDGGGRCSGEMWPDAMTVVAAYCSAEGWERKVHRVQRNEWTESWWYRKRGKNSKEEKRIRLHF
jgi:hypothetical protein